MSMHLHRSNQTKILRQAGVSLCKYCGTPVEWFQRYDALRIPLTNEFPSRRVPASLRWHINRGVAYPGTDASNGYCRIPHPAICPAVDHPDLPPTIQDLVRRLAVRMRTAIERGEFEPFVEPDDPVAAEEVESPGPEKVRQVRHVVGYHSLLRIGPCAIEDLQCIARDEHTEHRCEGRVADLSEGRWERVAINEEQATGRLGQMVLNLTGGSIWVWHLPDFNVSLRWWNQRCHDHFNSPQPDHTENEFVPFHPLRHDAFVLTERPTGYDLNTEDALLVIHDGPGERTKCAGPSCTNTSVLSPEEGWMCWQCEKLLRRRRAVHQRWGQAPEEVP
ncbi:DUF6083 domain-containing protein (plasmid) [Streptomyces sp. NBC_00111]|uniref:DUF6083 domain-containing protein n=1 Tax=Streptomyces sp. NBC_00111 TaxID=2975655 RepID=UPI00324F2277